MRLTKCRGCGTRRPGAELGTTHSQFLEECFYDEVSAEAAEANITLANNDFTAIASGVLAAVGGKDNVANVDYCATRLRFEVKDSTAVNEKAVKAAGAAGVIRPSKTACQVVIGPKVQFVYDELKKML